MNWTPPQGFDPKLMKGAGPGESAYWVPQELRGCEGCGARCCRAFSIAIPTPQTERDFDMLRYYVLHDGVSIRLQDDRTWWVEVNSSCTALKPDGMCSIYNTTAPEICKEPYIDQCERYCSTDFERGTLLYMRTVEDVERFADVYFKQCAEEAKSIGQPGEHGRVRQYEIDRPAKELARNQQLREANRHSLPLHYKGVNQK